jgi:hypothetical protein
MGYTLDQLLDETGVSDLGGSRLTKKASAEPTNFSKLAERCRRAAVATPEEVDDSANAELAEKTASIAIISRTLAEIRSIEGAPQEKVASPTTQPSTDVEAFIKGALDAGHSPEAIASFLDKQAGILDKLKGMGRELRATSAMRKAERFGAKAEHAGGSAFRQFQDHIRKAEGLGEKERDALVSKLRIKLGDERTGELLGDHPAFRSLPSAKGLKRKAAAVLEGKGDKALGLNIGGAQLGLSSEQLGKLKKPAALVGAGYLGHRALAGDKPEKKKSGVVVVNS